MQSEVLAPFQLDRGPKKFGYGATQSNRGPIASTHNQQPDKTKRPPNESPSFPHKTTKSHSHVH